MVPLSLPPPLPLSLSLASRPLYPTCISRSLSLSPSSPTKVVLIFFFLSSNISESKSQLTVTAQQSSNSDTVDGTGCSSFVQETDKQRSQDSDEQLPRDRLVQSHSNWCADDGPLERSEQKQSKTIKMHSNKKIDMTIVTDGISDGNSRNNNERQFNKSTVNRSKNINCDNFNESETNERTYGEASAAAAANSAGGGGISSDSGVGFELGLDDDDDTDEDPYAELEFYLEKVKVSVVLFSPEFRSSNVFKCSSAATSTTNIMVALDPATANFFHCFQFESFNVLNQQFVHCVQRLDNDHPIFFFVFSQVI